MIKNHIEIGGVHMGTDISKKHMEKPQNQDAFHTLSVANYCGVNFNCKPAPIMIDRDNFDAVLSNMAPALTLPINSELNPINLEFHCLEDFEPDSIYNRLAIFDELKTLRRQLLDPSSFSQAAESLGATQKNIETSPAPDNPYENNNALDLLLAETSQRQLQANYTENLSSNLIKDIIKPYIIPAPDPRKEELVASVDQATSQLMNQILHHKHFKALEASWRGIYFLVKRTETSANLKHFIYHCSKESLLNDLSENGITDSRFYKQAIEPFGSVPGSTAWSMILADFEFDTNELDVLLADILCQIAASQNSCLLAQANCHFAGYTDIAKSPDMNDWKFTNTVEFENAWQSLRQMSHSRHMALCFPHMLLRLPYGKHTRPVEQFAFEEMESDTHSNYLWGNSSYGAATLMSQAYTESGWKLMPGQCAKLNRMPIYSYKDEYGDNQIKPAAEILLTEKSGQQLAIRGLLPVWSILNSDEIKFGPFRSICMDQSLIKGNWN